MSLTPDHEALGRPAVADATSAVLVLTGTPCSPYVALIEETAVAALCAAVIREGYGAAPHGTPES